MLEWKKIIAMNPNMVGNGPMARALIMRHRISRGKQKGNQRKNLTQNEIFITARHWEGDMI